MKGPAKLFNASLDGNARRAIDINEGEEVDAGAFKALIRAAVDLNTSVGKARPRQATSTLRVLGRLQVVHGTCLPPNCA